MSARSLSNYKSHEEEFINFIRRCITSGGGTLKLQHITGYMSQLAPEVRAAIGTTIADFLRVFSRHKDLFTFNNSEVSFRDPSTCDDLEYDSDESNIESRALPLKIVEGKGVIVKLSSDYGFIKTKEPLKTEIYFNASALGQRGIDLTSILYTGNIVFFDAKKNNREGKCKYSALKVWRADGSTPQDSQLVPKPRKTRETGLYDPLTLDGAGIIQKVFPNLGFIAVDGNDKNTVFFYKNRLANYENLVDLTKVLSRGDPVEFNAHRTTKEDAKARWEATKVWKKSVKTKQNAFKPESREDQKVFESTLLKQSKMKINSMAKEMIRGQKGKICPRAPGAVIKFNNNELADGDSALYYISGAKVVDIGWEFSEGDDVFFDAVKIKSAPGWKAVLVWSGKKPDVVLPTCVGDFSEFTDEESEVASPIPTLNLSSKSGSSNSSLKSVSIKSESNSFKSKDNGKVSSSSLKSVSVKSESNSFKGKDDVEVASSKLKDSAVKKKEQYKKWSEPSNMVCSPVRLPSFNEPQRLKKESKDEYSPDVKFEQHSFSSWADSPYLEDINNEDTLTFEGDKFDSRSVDTADSDSNNIPRAEKKNILEHVNSTEVNPRKNNEFLDLPKMKNKVDKSQTSEWKQKVSTERETKEKIISKTKREVDQHETLELNERACVKTFKSITGNISKVYSKFAEVVTTHSQKTVSFFWNDFYINGVSLEELEIDDLKQVLKVGEAVKFNYFIIVDDSGKTWQKVSLAWVHSKPRVPFEMSPKDFIEQNNLSVTISEEDEIQEEKVFSKKFLAVISDDDLDQDDKISQTESGFEEGVPSTSVEYSNEHNDNLSKVNTNELSKEDIKAISSSTLQDDKLSEIESCSEDCYFLTPGEDSELYKDVQSPVDMSNLSSTVCHLLKKDLFSSSSKVDLYSLSEEIINLVLESYKKSNESFDEVLPEAASNTEKVLNVCSKCQENYVNAVFSEDKNLKDNEVQTIVTGDVIAQNICPDC